MRGSPVSFGSGRGARSMASARPRLSSEGRFRELQRGPRIENAGETGPARPQRVAPPRFSLGLWLGPEQKGSPDQHS